MELKLREKLSEYGYKNEYVNNYVNQFSESEILQPVLLNWLETGIETDCECEGFTAFGLMKNLGNKYPTALSNIAWLAESPIEAKKMLTRRRDVVI
jgi:hypothetical protein